MGLKFKLDMGNISVHTEDQVSSNIQILMSFRRILLFGAIDHYCSRLWNIVDSTCETTELAQEGLAVSFSPCGQLVAVLTVDSNVTLYHAKDVSF